MAHMKTQVKRGDDKILAKMLRDVSPVGWLAAADYLDEIGQSGRAEFVRRRAIVTLEIIAAVNHAHSQVWSRVHHRRIVESGNRSIRVSGGRKQLAVWFSRIRDGLWVFMTSSIKVSRRLLAQPGYLSARAAELAEMYLAKCADGFRAQK